MAEHHDNSELEMGADMDYEEHERSFNTFVSVTKWGILVNVALLITLLFYFFGTDGGVWNGLYSLILFLALCFVGRLLLK